MRNARSGCCPRGERHGRPPSGRPDEVTQVFQTTPVVWIENPNPRADSSRWLIGPTRGGRFLTVVVDPDATDHGRWHVMTAWEPTEAQIRLDRNAR